MSIASYDLVLEVTYVISDVVTNSPIGILFMQKYVAGTPTNVAGAISNSQECKFCEDRFLFFCSSESQDLK